MRCQARRSGNGLKNSGQIGKNIRYMHFLTFEIRKLKIPKSCDACFPAFACVEHLQIYLLSIKCDSRKKWGLHYNPVHT